MQTTKIAPAPGRARHGRFARWLGCCLVAASVAGADYYIAPNGNDSAAGTLAAPFRSLTKLATVVIAGDHAYLRGGTYGVRRVIESWEQLEQLNDITGTAEQPIIVENYPRERPVFDYTGYTYAGGAIGLYLVGSHFVHVKGIRITNIAQMSDGSAATAVAADGSTDNVFENIEVDHIGGYGFALGSGSDNNRFINCDAHHIDDRYTPGTAYGNSNGFSVFGRADVTGITFDHCRAWLCSDDGFDVFGCDGLVTFTDCWAFQNGFVPASDGTLSAVGDGMGFKLGPIDLQYPTELKRVVTGCISFDNRRQGFDENGNYSGQGIFHLYNNTSFRNGSYGFWGGEMSGVTHDVRNNASIQDVGGQCWGDEWTGSFNTWNLGLTPTGADFLSLDSTGVDGPRSADGSLPVLPFLKPSASSRVIDRGVDVGLPYRGGAPDLGAFEFTAATTTGGTATGGATSGGASAGGTSASGGSSGRHARCGVGGGAALAIAAALLVGVHARRGTRASVRPQDERQIETAFNRHADKRE